MVKKLKINENFKSRRKWRSEDVSKKRRSWLIALSFFLERSRMKFAFRWKVVVSVNCLRSFKKARKKVPLLVNFQTSKLALSGRVCLPFDLLTANNFETVKSAIYTLNQTCLTSCSIRSFHELHH